jgi:hypothetical protein
VPNTEPLVPSQQLRVAIDKLPNPDRHTSDTFVAQVSDLRLGGEVIGHGAIPNTPTRIPVEFHRTPDGYGAQLWVYEGPVEADRFDADEDGELVAWLKGKLGDRCEIVEVLERQSDSRVVVRVKIR